MFHFPRFPAHDYFIHRALPDSSPGGFPHSDIRVSLLTTAPRGFSQLVTSFFGSLCQGIHLMLFFA